MEEDTFKGLLSEEQISKIDDKIRKEREDALLCEKFKYHAANKESLKNKNNSIIEEICIAIEKKIYNRKSNAALGVVILNNSLKLAFESELFVLFNFKVESELKRVFIMGIDMKIIWTNNIERLSVFLD